MITGVSGGLGTALAKEVLNNGDFVIATFRKPEEVDAFNKVNKDRGRAYLLDLSETASIPDTVARIIGECERIDVLVNNAGAGFTGAIEETSLEEARKIFEVNVFGTLQLTRAVLPHMRQRGSGHILQISSHGGIKAFAGFGIYNASKFALEGFSEALAQETAPLGIRVTLIEPGPFRTRFAGDSLREAEIMIPDYQETAGKFRSLLRSVHGKQEGDPEKAAKAVTAFVASGSDRLRLPLGSIALKTIQAKVDEISSDLEAHQGIAASTIY